MKHRFFAALLLLTAFYAPEVRSQAPSRYLARSVADTDYVWMRNQAKAVMGITYDINISSSSGDFFADRSESRGDKPATMENIKKLEKKLTGKPSDALVYNEIGSLYKRMGKKREGLDYFVKAEQQIKKLLADNPGNKDYIEAAALIYVNIENYNEAIVYFRELHFIDPANETIYLFMPMCYMATNQMEHGKLFIDSALTRDPKNLPALILKMLWQMNDWMAGYDSSLYRRRFYNKRPEDVINFTYARKTAEQFPESFGHTLFYQYTRTLGLTLKMLPGLNQDKLQFSPDSTDRVVTSELLAFFNEAAQRKDWKNKYIIYKCLGMLRVLQNDFKGGQQQFLKALPYKPLNTCTTMDHAGELYGDLIGTCMLMRDTAGAEKWLREKIKVVPAIDPQAADYEALAYYCLQRGDLAGVRDNIARAIELNPDAANPHLLLAAASLLEKNTANAEQEIDIALRINKNESGAGLLLAISQFEQKNFDNACMLIENEMRNNPGYEVARNMYKRYFIKKK